MRRISSGFVLLMPVYHIVSLFLNKAFTKVSSSTFTGNGIDPRYQHPGTSLQEKPQETNQRTAVFTFPLTPVTLVRYIYIYIYMYTVYMVLFIDLPIQWITFNLFWGSFPTREVEQVRKG